MSTLAAAFATTVLATAPLQRKAKRKFFIFSSNFPNIGGLPYLIVASFFTGDELPLLRFKVFRYLSRNILTVLSLR